MDKSIFSPSKSGTTVTVTMMENVIEDIHSNDSAPSDNLDTWQNYGLPKPILDALSDLKFSYPTHIQTLTLPAAILGMYYNFVVNNYYSYL